MCFKINERAKRPNRRVAYKVVRLNKRTGRVSSDIKEHYTWFPGLHTIAKRAKTFTQTAWQGRARFAQQGFYVYTTRSAAESNRIKGSWFYSNYEWIVLKVHVRPRDWLFSGPYGTVATYRAVTVPEDQPEIEWY